MVTSQYRKIADFDSVLWEVDSPVVVEKMRLAHDRIYGTNVLQITFRNVTDVNIYGLSINITLKDEAGRPIYQDVTYNYYGIEVPSSRSFGASDDIIVEPEAASFDITVQRAEFSDGKFFRGNVLLRRMPEALPTATMGEFEAPFLAKIEQMRPKLKVLCAPEGKEHYWRCVCRRIYPRGIKKCPFCRMEGEKLLDVLPELKREKRRQEAEAARLEKERLEEEQRRREEEELRRQEEQRRLEEEERARQEREAELLRQKKEKQKRMIRIASAAACVAIILGVAIRFLPFRSPAGEDTPPTAGDQLDPSISPEPANPQPTEDIQPEKVIWPTTLIIGSELSEEHERTLWRLFGTSEKALGEHEVISIPLEQNQKFYSALYGRENVETNAQSALLLRRGLEGSGLKIVLYNITYCTEQMYREALEDLGVTDAYVIVASPTGTSGTTALTGLALLANHMDDYVGTGIGTATSRIAMNIRSGSSVRFGKYDMIPPGTEVEVLEILENGWYRIAWPGSPLGYAYSSNVDNAYYSFHPYESDS